MSCLFFLEVGQNVKTIFLNIFIQKFLAGPPDGRSLARKSMATGSPLLNAYISCKQDMPALEYV